MPLPVIASMLRLGKKYDFKHIGTQAIKYLKEHFPDTVFFSDFKVFVNQHLFVDVIVIAQENSLLSILSVAYWQLLMKCNPVGPAILHCQYLIISYPNFFRKKSLLFSIIWIPNKRPSCGGTNLRIRSVAERIFVLWRISTVSHSYPPSHFHVAVVSVRVTVQRS